MNVQSHLDKRPQSTSYLFRIEILNTLFILQMSWKHPCMSENAWTKTKHKDDTQDNKNTFFIIQHTTNFKKVQIELVPVITATKLFLRYP